MAFEDAFRTAIENVVRVTKRGEPGEYEKAYLFALILGVVEQAEIIGRRESFKAAEEAGFNRGWIAAREWFRRYAIRVLERL